ncbi:hypothetical protein AaE_000366, partial [Aphanomyces astaci]
MDLKVALTKQMPNTIHCHTHRIQLYQGYHDAQWMTTDNYMSLLQRCSNDTLASVMEGLHSMEPLDRVYDVLGGVQPPPSYLHILVVLPTSEIRVQQHLRDHAGSQRVEFSLLNVQVGDLNAFDDNTWINTWRLTQVTDFPDQLYVRKEYKDLFSLLKRRGDKQVVLFGSPGLGKSLLVVLYAVWMATQAQSDVLLVRRVEGKGLTVLFLNGSDLSKCWREQNLSEDNVEALEAATTTKCALCLDGINQVDGLLKKVRLQSFSVLATSGQYKKSQSQAGVVDLCLVPYWSLEDLKAVGRRINGWDDDCVEQKYYIGGSCLRLFLMSIEDARIAILLAVGTVDVSTADLLKTQHGPRSAGQVDSIRMATLDSSKVANYSNPDMWSYAITSMYALGKIGEIVPLGYFKDLCFKAHALNDFGLFGIAFENYVHATAQNNGEIKLWVRDYERQLLHQPKNAKLDYSYATTTITTQSCSYRGHTQEQYEAIMREWTTGLEY